MGSRSRESLGLSHFQPFDPQLRETDMNTPNYEGASYDAATIAYEAAIHHLFLEEPKWRLAPFAVAYFRETEERVYFDYDNRPIFRATRDGQVEIIPPDGFVCFSLLADLHADLDGRFDPSGRRIVIDLIERYGLVPELNRRWELFQRNALPGPAWGGRA